MGMVAAAEVGVVAEAGVEVVADAVATEGAGDRTAPVVGRIAPVAGDRIAPVVGQIAPAVGRTLAASGVATIEATPE